MSDQEQEHSLQLPHPWERHFSEDDSSFYFYNPVTGECFWQDDVERAIQEDDENVEGGGVREEEDLYNEKEYNNNSQISSSHFPIEIENLSEEELKQLYHSYEGYTHSSNSPSYTLGDLEHRNYDELFQQEKQLMAMRKYIEESNDETQLGSLQNQIDSLSSLRYDEYSPSQEDYEANENYHENYQEFEQEYVNTHESEEYINEYQEEERNLKALTEMTVIERTQFHLQNKDKKINQLKQEQEEKIKKESPTGHPQINKKSQGMNRSVQDMLQWEEERKKKLKQKAEQFEYEIKEKHTGHPKVTKLAKNLAKRRELNEIGEEDSYTDYDLQSVQTSTTNLTTASQNSLHQRLMSYEEKKKQKIQQKIKSMDKEAKENSKPSLAPMTHKIINQQRAQQQYINEYYANEMNQYQNEDLFSLAENSVGTSASDRLYALSKLREKSDYEVQNSFLSGGKMYQHDEKTGQRLFEPRINPTSRAIASKKRDSNLPVEDQLRIKGLIYQRKSMEKEMKAQILERSLRESKPLNSVSEKLVAERMMINGETSKERLNKPIRSFKDRTVKTLSEDSPSFKPQISQGSKEILSQLGNRYRYCPSSQVGEEKYINGSDDSFLLMQDWDIYSNAPQDGQPICVDDIRGQRKPNNLYVENPNNIYERTNYWHHARAKRLEQERGERDKELMKECSFKPKTSGKSAKIVTKGPISDRHNQWAKEKEERMERERRKKIEEEERYLTFTPTVLPSPTYNKTNNSNSNTNKSIESYPNIVPPPFIVSQSINSLRVSSNSSSSLQSANLNSYNTQQVTNPKEYSLYSEETSRRDLFPPPPPPPPIEELNSNFTGHSYQYSSQSKKIPVPKKISLAQVQFQQDVSSNTSVNTNISNISYSKWDLQDPDEQFNTRTIPQYSNGNLITPVSNPNLVQSSHFSQSDFDYSRFKNNFKPQYEDQTMEQNNLSNIQRIQIPNSFQNKVPIPNSNQKINNFNNNFQNPNNSYPVPPKVSINSIKPNMNYNYMESTNVNNQQAPSISPRAPQNMHYILNPFEDDDEMSMSQAVDLDY